jgi:hypothetical protein
MPRAPKYLMIEHLRKLLADAFALHQRGGTGQSVGRAYGTADGYMLALIDAAVVGEVELRALVAEERARLLGPGSRTLTEADQGAGAEQAA